MTLSPADQNTLEGIIRQAGQKLMQYWPGTAEKISHPTLSIQNKEDGSPVSAADIASNEILLAGLRKNWPQIKIISEETPEDPQLHAAEDVWIIDPLDGTKSFINARDDFSVLVGLCQRSQIEFGMMYFPALNILAKAGRGMGASINQQLSKVSDAQELRKHSLYYRNFSPQAAEYLYPNLMDSGMAFLALCRAELDGIIIRMSTHKEWDLAAPAVMIEESGGQISDEHGNPIRFNQNGIDYKYLVASNGRVHGKLLEIVREVRT